MKCYTFMHVCVKCGQVCGGVLIYFGDVCDVYADRPKGFAPHRCADVSLFLLLAFNRSHIINSVNEFL